MTPSRLIQLTDQEDYQLRQIEQDSYLGAKVRLRAQVLRLSSHAEKNIAQIAAYTGRSTASISRDLDRWVERGFEGLADGTAPGNPPTITAEVREFMERRLSEERTYNATQLAEAVAEGFGVEVSPEAIRQHLHSMGYSWKRTRYVPSKPPDPEHERQARKELDGLKKGREKGRSS